MAATVLIEWFGNSPTEPTGQSVEGSPPGLKFTRDQTPGGGTPPTPIPIPTAGTPGATVFSFPKQLALVVTTGGGTTSLLNRRVSAASTPSVPPGIGLWARGNPTYANDTVPLDSDNTTANGATPSGYFPIPIAPAAPLAYDNSLVACTTGARNGWFCVVGIGVSLNYTLGAGNLSLPAIQITYDEQ
jgi:hypothetical protein